MQQENETRSRVGRPGGMVGATEKSQGSKRSIWAALMLSAGLTACSGGGGGNPVLYDGHNLDGGDDGGAADDGGGSGPGGETQNKVVGLLEIAAPTESAFFLKGTLPVPPGTLKDGARGEPFTVQGPDGRAWETQVTVVSRYADAARDGADVVEVLSHVELPGNATPGDRLLYRVVHRGQRKDSFKPTRKARSFIAAPSSLTLHTKDVFGNRYRADLLKDIRGNGGEARELRRGKLVKEWETHEILRCNDEDSNNKLDRMMGVHTFLSTWREDNVMTVGMRVHNGLSGLNPNSPVDDAYKQIYFDKLELRLPQGWTLVHAFEDPFIGEPYNDEGWTYFPIVRPMDDGTMHVLRTQGQFTRRFAIAPIEEVAHARVMIQEQGLAFCQPGISPDGIDLWSWWNPETSRWFAQNCRLPLIDEELLPGIRQAKRDTLFELEDHLANGTHAGYPLVDGPMGFWRPWGAPYGGMTGGVEVDLSFGIESAAAASRDAYRLAQLMSRMYTDRQHTALYNADGRPTQMEQWLKEGPHGLYFPGLFNEIPLLPANDPFGFEDAPTFQTEAVIAMGKKPSYQDDLYQYKPVDIQHWVRFLRPFKMLAWVGNDALAKSEIEMAAEIYRITHHEYPNNASGSVSASWGLHYAQNHVAERPGQGYGFNRANGWGIDIAVSSFALGTREQRHRFYPWFEKLVDVAEAGQSTCGGYLQAVPHHSNSAQYRIRQNYESAITDNALRGLANTVFREHDDSVADRIDDIMVRKAYGMISPAFWSQDDGAPHGTVAVGPHSLSQPPFCGNATDHWASDAVDTKYPWNTLAYAYELTGDDIFMAKAGEAAGTPNLFGLMNSDQLGDLNNKFAMLTLLQVLNNIE